MNLAFNGAEAVVDESPAAMLVSPRQDRGNPNLPSEGDGSSANVILGLRTTLTLLKWQQVVLLKLLPQGHSHNHLHQHSIVKPTRSIANRDGSV
jgi:hypothetical protein